MGLSVISTFSEIPLGSNKHKLIKLQQLPRGHIHFTHKITESEDRV